MLVAELFESHDRRRFEVIGYSYGRPDDTPLRRRLERGLDQFVDLRAMSHTEAARRIAADQIDILVDLKGYTVGARTEILADRPAPIQVNYLGFPGTMGAPFIDYILVDEFVVPSNQQPYYTEQLVHLPGCYQVNDSRRKSRPASPLAAIADYQTGRSYFARSTTTTRLRPRCSPFGYVCCWRFLAASCGC